MVFLLWDVALALLRAHSHAWGLMSFDLVMAACMAVCLVWGVSEARQVRRLKETAELERLLTEDP